MYRYLDRPIAQLDHESRFLLWAIRTAATAITERRCLGAALGREFHAHRACAALPHFAIAMAVLLRGGDTPIALSPCDYPQVTENEALLLTLFGAVDEDADCRVEGALKLIGYPPQEIVTLHRAIRTVTAHLLEAGLAPPTPLPREMR